MVIGTISVAIGGFLVSDSFSRQNYQGCWLRAASDAGGPGEPQLSSGDHEIDAFCDKELRQLNNLFGVRPAFRYFTGEDSNNAFATSDIVDPSHPDGTVMLGTNLAEELSKNYKAIAWLPLAAVLAHEWGHILQYARAYESAWDVEYELHADSGAGWYLLKTRGHELLKRHAHALSGYFQTLGSRRFNNFRYHGTPTQRKNELLTSAGLIESVVPLSDWQNRTAAQALGIEE